VVTAQVRDAGHRSPST